MDHPRTLRELRAARYKTLPVKDELRLNLIKKLRSGEKLFPGIVGYQDTVIPQLINAILSRHNIILLGLRGQAKSRIIRLLTDLLDERIPIIAGIWPLVSVRNAEFLANEVPGVVVPDAVITRMRNANDKSKEHAVAEGIAIAREMLTCVRAAVQGVQVSAPFGKVDLALEVFRDTATTTNAA